MDEKKIKELNEEVEFRTTQLSLLYNILIKNQTILYPAVHLFGLTGTGKTHLIRRFMAKFCNGPKLVIRHQQSEIVNRYSVFINCNELFYASLSSLFNEILTQLRSALHLKSTDDDEDEFNMSIAYENGEFEANDDDVVPGDNCPDEEMQNMKMNDCASFLGRLRRLFQTNSSSSSSSSSRACLYLVFDNAESLKYFGEASNLLLTLTKLNEYANMTMPGGRSGLSICTLFVSEIDWHSLISECELMSKTESPRPFNVYFNEYTKDQMKKILNKTAIKLLRIQENALKSVTDSKSTTATTTTNNNNNNNMDIEFYIGIILDVFFPICKDLNEIQYLIQIYYDQLICSINATNEAVDTTSSADKMKSAWTKMRPFIKQALTQIYLRQSMFNSSNPQSAASSSSQSMSDENLTREFEKLNILAERSSDVPSFLNKNPVATNQLPRLMKYLIISAYVATHNPAKYDKKLFEYNSTNKSRRSKFTAHKIQQNEENQRAAALKTQTFDLNRLMAIFFAICHESGHTVPINLSQIQLNLKTLKSLHYLQQSNSSYSSLDEPKFKCLIDFETILSLSSSVNFNIKQYLAEYITI